MFFLPSYILLSHVELKLFMFPCWFEKLDREDHTFFPSPVDKTEDRIQQTRGENN